LTRSFIDPFDDEDAVDDVGDADFERLNLLLTRSRAPLALLLKDDLDDPDDPDDGDLDLERLNFPLTRLDNDPFGDDDLERERDLLSRPRNDLVRAFILVMLGLLTFDAALLALVLNPEKLAPICSATISRAIRASWLRCRMRSPSAGSAISTRSMGTSNLTYSGW